MASDVIESEVVLKGVGDMNLNKSNPDSVTPRTTRDERGNKLASSPSSSGVSGEGNEEEVEDLPNSTVPPVKNGEEALQESPTKTRGTPQERTSPDNEQKHPGARSSTPVSLPQPRSPPGPIGRSVYVDIFFFFHACCATWTYDLLTARMLLVQMTVWLSVCECFPMHRLWKLCDMSLPALIQPYTSANCWYSLCWALPIKEGDIQTFWHFHVFRLSRKASQASYTEVGMVLTFWTSWRGQRQICSVDYNLVSCISRLG